MHVANHGMKIWHYNKMFNFEYLFFMNCANMLQYFDAT